MKILTMKVTTVAVLAILIALQTGCSETAPNDETESAAAFFDERQENGTTDATESSQAEKDVWADLGSICGNGTCEKTENCSQCSEDCGICPPQCGDTECNGSETCEGCPEDCGTCSAAPQCGDGVCSDNTETCETCEDDCGLCSPVCGDAICEEEEEESCAEDCPETGSCGNDTCDETETCDTCWADCGPCTPLCGDGWCSPEEKCESCPVDCGSCAEQCGDGMCAGSENCSNCAEDCGGCGATCGDEACDETESCADCPSDCGPCPCSEKGEELPLPDNLICQPSGCLGGVVDCSLKLARHAQTSEPASALQFKIQYDAKRLLLENFYDEVCYAEDFCVEVALTKMGAKPNHTGHQFTVLPPGEVPMNPEPDTQYLWNGVVNAIVANYTGPSSTLTDAFFDVNGDLQGDPHVAWVRFRLLAEIPVEERAWVRLPKDGPNDLLGAGASLIELPATVQDGVIITQDP